jgi:hypothetical protein
MVRPHGRVALGAGVAVALLVLVPLGKLERSRWIDRENSGLGQIRADVGARFARPAGFRIAPLFACLLYGSEGQSRSRELCFDRSGAIVEAISRRPGRDLQVWTLRSEPSVARLHESPVAVARILDRMHAQTGDSIVVGSPDLGPRRPVPPS